MTRCKRPIDLGTPVKAGLAIVASVVVCTASAETDFSRPTGFFDTARTPEYGPATVPLRVLMAEAGVPRGQPERFCVVGYRFSGGERQAYVYWPRRQRLILWEGATDPLTRVASIARSRRPWDLRKDVVADENAVGGSTYLVTKVWVQRKIADCAKHGRQYRVARQKAKR